MLYYKTDAVVVTTKGSRCVVFVRLDFERVMVTDRVWGLFAGEIDGSDSLGNYHYYYETRLTLVRIVLFHPPSFGSRTFNSTKEVTI